VPIHHTEYRQFWVNYVVEEDEREVAYIEVARLGDDYRQWTLDRIHWLVNNPNSIRSREERRRQHSIQIQHSLQRMELGWKEMPYVSINEFNGNTKGAYETAARMTEAARKFAEFRYGPSTVRCECGSNHCWVANPPLSNQFPFSSGKILSLIAEGYLKQRSKLSPSQELASEMFREIRAQRGVGL
jgi:hypothetical protein